MGDEADAGGAAQLVLPLEAALEVDDEPLEQQLPDVGELGVDDGGEAGVHVGERRGRSLRLRSANNQLITGYVGQYLIDDKENMF